MASFVVFGLLCMVSYLAVECTGAYLDLTHDLDNTSAVWPGSQQFELEILEKGQTDHGYWFQGDQACASSHVGTHMDAPSHFYKDAWAVNEIPPERLMASAVMIDIRDKASENPDTNLTLSDVQNWESEYGQIPKGSVVIQCSGWSDKYSDKAAYFGNDREDATDFHFPSFNLEAVQWLVNERDIVGIAVDTPSIDYGPSPDFVVHVFAASNNVYGLENVKDTCDIPPFGAMLYSFPAKYAGASGAPVRIMALWDTNPSSYTINHQADCHIIFAVLFYCFFV